MITNCASAGAASSTNPVTGVVSRPDPLTGQPTTAPIKLNGGTEEPAVSHAAETVSLSSSVMDALLAFQQA